MLCSSYLFLVHHIPTLCHLSSPSLPKQEICKDLVVYHLRNDLARQSGLRGAPCRYYRVSCQIFSPEWLLPPQSGEIFENLEYYNRRLRAFFLATSFDIIRKGGGIKALPSWSFFCFYHGTATRNDRMLEAHAEVDEEGNIASRRQHDTINVQQLNCQWEGLCSLKSIGK